jgi:hypothetical protein
MKTSLCHSEGGGGGGGGEGGDNWDIPEITSLGLLFV